MVNSRCVTLIKNRPGSQRFKHCNRLTEDYNIVSTRKISQLQAHKLAIAATLAFQRIQTPMKAKKNYFIYTDFSYPDFFHFPRLLPDQFGIPWLFQVFQVSGHPVCIYICAASWAPQPRGCSLLYTLHFTAHGCATRWIWSHFVTFAVPNNTAVSIYLSVYFSEINFIVTASYIILCND